MNRNCILQKNPRRFRIWKRMGKERKKWTARRMYIKLCKTVRQGFSIWLVAELQAQNFCKKYNENLANLPEVEIFAVHSLMAKHSSICVQKGQEQGRQSRIFGNIHCFHHENQNWIFIFIEDSEQELDPQYSKQRKFHIWSWDLMYSNFQRVGMSVKVTLSICTL